MTPYGRNLQSAYVAESANLLVGNRLLCWSQV
jgi:hypothetical protein